MEEGSLTRIELARDLGLSGSVVSDRCKQLGIKLRYRQALTPGQLADFYELHQFLENTPEGYQRALQGFKQYKTDLAAGTVKNSRTVYDLESKIELFRTIAQSLDTQELKQYARSFSPFIYRDFLEKGLELRWRFSSEEVADIFNREDLDRIDAFEPLPGYRLVKLKNRWLVKSTAREGRDKGRKLQSLYERDLLSMRENWSEVELTGALLPGACFDKSILDRCILTGCLLTEASFIGTHIRDGELSYAILTRSNFSQAIADGIFAEQTTAMETCWDDAALSKAVLRQANLANSSFQNATLVGADLSEANFSGSTLKGADLTDSNLRGANFQGCDLKDARLDGATLESTDFTGAML